MSPCGRKAGWSVYPGEREKPLTTTWSVPDFWSSFATLAYARLDFLKPQRGISTIAIDFFANPLRQIIAMVEPI